MQSNVAYEAEEMARYVRCGCAHHIGMLKNCLGNCTPEDARVLWAILQTRYPKEADAIRHLRSRAA